MDSALLPNYGADGPLSTWAAGISMGRLGADTHTLSGGPTACTMKIPCCLFVSLMAVILVLCQEVQGSTNDQSVISQVGFDYRTAVI